MPTRSQTRGAKASSRGTTSASCGQEKHAKIILDPQGDEAITTILAKIEEPSTLTPAVGFKAIWVLKSLAARAKALIYARRAAGEKAVQRTKKRKPQSGKDLLNSRLEFVGLQMKTIDGDGNCQFRACSDQLFGTQEHHAQVRQCAVDYMRRNAADFSCYVADAASFEKYLDVMLKGSRGKPTWGDELTLRAICNHFGTTIHVLTSAEGRWNLKYEPEKVKTTKLVFLAYISPAHYNAFELGSGTPRAPPSAATTTKKSRKAAV